MAAGDTRDWLRDPILEASEETFLLFSDSLPSHNLGFVDNHVNEIELDIQGQSFVLKQSPAILNSARNNGTTGAVLWKITPLVGRWLASMPLVLQQADVLKQDSVVVELGCGITGLIGMLLAPKVASYVLTDQAYVRRLIEENIATNMISKSQRKSAKAKAAIHPTSVPIFVPLDWETDTPTLEGLGLNPRKAIDMIIVCDCVYNDFLIQPLVQTLVDVCSLRSSATTDSHTTVLIAQQLRSEDIFESFLSALLQHFQVWRMPDEHLSPELKIGTGYAVHIAYLRPTAE